MPEFPDGTTTLVTGSSGSLYVLYIALPPTSAGTRSVGVISRFPAAPINYDGTIYVEMEDFGRIGLATYAEFNHNILVDTESRVGTGSYSRLQASFKSFGGPSRIVAGSRGGGTIGFRIDPPRSNFVMWSNIGSADFTIWKDNIAGERALDWKGFVYDIKKLGNKAIAYGENGVSMLIPAGNTYGLQTVHRMGVKGKNAVAGDETTHFFIDTAGKLFAIGENKMRSALFESALTPVPLGYEEYLSSLNNPVLSLDSQDNLLYICDGLQGFVYSITDGSLGRGPAIITGIGRQGGYLYAAASEVIAIQPFEICTDIYDFGSNSHKTIHRVDIGTDAEDDLFVAIDYRRSRRKAFSITKWKPVPISGKTLITALGREFRIRVKALTYEAIQLDFIRIQGITHDS